MLRLGPCIQLGNREDPSRIQGDDVPYIVHMLLNSCGTHMLRNLFPPCFSPLTLTTFHGRFLSQNRTCPENILIGINLVVDNDSLSICGMRCIIHIVQSTAIAKEGGRHPRVLLCDALCKNGSGNSRRLVTSRTVPVTIES